MGLRKTYHEKNRMDFMKISLVNFSDVHFMEKNNSILEKKEKIITAILSRTHHSDKIIYIMNGDSAFSGKKEQYSLASEFFLDIINRTRGDSFFCVAGNHDCDFSQMDEETREVLVKAINDPQNPRSTMIDKVIVQNNFNDYFHSFSEKWPSNVINVDENQIFRSIDLLMEENTKIRLNLFNTAWDSTLNEKPGTLYMPIQKVANINYDSEAILNISVIHHPTNWLEPNNKREFDALLNDISDLILLGHEHADNVIYQKSNYGDTSFIEGSVLQENGDPNKSGFNIINISTNLEEKKRNQVSLTQFEWDEIKNIYKCSSEHNLDINTKIRKVNHLGKNNNNYFILSDEKENDINDLGTPIRHPRISSLELEDIFIYPVLIDKLAQKDDKKTISGEQLLQEVVVNNGVWLIEGDKESGKTTLLKKMYKHFFDEKIVPIYFDSEKIKDKRALSRIDKLIKAYFKEQYEGDMYEEYLQLSKEKKVILLDNWELCGINKKGKKKLLSELLLIFDRVIIMVESSPTNNSDLLEISDGLSTTLRYIGIRNFGYKKREELVEKWIRLGSEYDLEDKQIFIDIDKYTKQISEIIGKSYVPQLPIYILIILQTMDNEAIDNGRELSDFNNRSNGYYYELLIKQLIMDLKMSPNEMSTLHNYLSHFAYKIFLKDEKSLNYSEWKSFHNLYVKEYQLDERAVSFEDYREKLKEKKIIKIFYEDRYSFSYNYFLYFFTAQYLANNISEPKIKEIIKELINNIHIEINANILLFLSHLSKDNFILESVISVANEILEDIPPLRMDDDIKELNELMTQLPTLVFKNTSTRENREQYNEIKDLDEVENKHYMEENLDHDLSMIEEEKNSEEDTLLEKDNVIIEIDKAHRISEVIGQILKNYSGSILGTIKQNLLNSAYDVSLRAGNMLINIINTEKDELVSFISERIKEDELIEENNQKEVEAAAKQMVFLFVEMISFSIVQKSIKDTGTSALKITYETISEKDISPVRKLIISGSYLETMHVNPSRGYIHDVFTEMDKNLIVKSVLQRMVAKYMYLFELPQNERQQIANKFNMRYSSVMQARLEKNSR